MAIMVNGHYFYRFIVQLSRICIRYIRTAVARFAFGIVLLGRSARFAARAGWVPAIYIMFEKKIIYQ